MRMSGLMARAKSTRWVFNCGDWMPSEQEWMRLATGIQQEEKDRIGKFVFKKDAKSSMAGRLLMRKFVVDSTGLNWTDVFINRDARGKPIYDNDKFQLKFNISHQGQYAVLAGEIGMINIGVDVMKIEYSGGKSVDEFFRIMNRQFSDDEWSVVKSPSSDLLKLKYFYRFWCLKESYVKATGMGLRENLREISFKLCTESLDDKKFVVDTKLFLKGIEQKDWTFQEMLIDDEHCVAVALNVNSDDYNNMDSVECFQIIDYTELASELGAILPPDPEYSKQFIAKWEKP